MGTRNNKQGNTIRKGVKIMNLRDKGTSVISLKDKRLLDIGEFSVYASVGTAAARELAEVSNAVFRIGRRILVDRVKFDEWCDEHSEA